MNASPSARFTVWGTIRLLRPGNVVLFFAGTALGGVLAAGDAAFSAPRQTLLLLAMGAAACIGAAANALNDVYDLAIDRVNRPERPLPQGTSTPAAAWLVWGFLSALGVSLAAFLTVFHLALALGAVALLWVYNATLKRVPFWGNLAVATILGIALLFGGLAVGPLAGASMGALFAFLTTLAREVVKDIEDVEGDRLDGARTLPLVWGVRRAAWTVGSILGLTLLTLPVPVFMPGLGSPFLAYILPAAVMLLAALWTLLNAADNHLPTVATQVSRLLKLTMVAGVVALAAARLL